MRRHAKSSPAGLTRRQGSRLGRIFRGAATTLAHSFSANGSGAPFCGAPFSSSFGGNAVDDLAVSGACAGHVAQVVESGTVRASHRLALCVVAVAITLTSAVGVSGASAADPPDGRKYELVSPPDKTHSEVSQTFALDQAAPSGDAIAWVSTAGFAGAEGSVLRSPYVSFRGTDSWVTRGLTVPQDPAFPVITLFLPYGYADDLSSMVFRQNTPRLHPDAPTGRNVASLYLRHLVGPREGSFDLISDFQGGVPPTSLFGGPPFDFRGGSQNFGHIVFRTPYKLTPTAPSFGDSEYEWVAATGQVRHIGILPDETTFVQAQTGGPGGAPLRAQDAVSADGSRIYFTAITGPTPGQLYLRQGGTSSVHVSASQRTDGAGNPAPDPAGPQQAAFWTASSDGRRAFFTSCEKLTDDATAVTSLNFSRCDDLQAGLDGVPSPENARNDLYMFDAETGTLTDLTTSDATGGSVMGVMGANELGTRVYFVAGGVLAAGAVLNEPNLYLWQDDGTPDGKLSLLATLGHEDLESWGRFRNQISGGGFDLSVMAFAASEMRSRVTPDGRFLMFQSTRPLAGLPTGGLSQVYLFDSNGPPSDRMVCVSCPSDGRVPVHQARIVPVGGKLQMHVPRYLSADGQRVFFETKESLVPHDGNGRVDVYMYEDGVAQLISTGASPADSWFVDASQNGDTAFFKTREQLSGWDIASADLDIYAARIGSGLPEPPPPPLPCEGDACQGAPSGPPPALKRGTASLAAAGNAKPERQRTRKVRCGKGKRKVRRGGKTRCVRKQNARSNKRNANSDRRTSR